MTTKYYLKKDDLKKKFKDVFGCDPSVFSDVKVYVDGQGAGMSLINLLGKCGINVSSFMKQKDGIILDENSDSGLEIPENIEIENTSELNLNISGTEGVSDEVKEWVSSEINKVLLRHIRPISEDVCGDKE